MHGRRDVGGVRRFSARVSLTLAACVLAVSACTGSERKSAGPRSAGDSLLAAGDSLYAREKYDSARTVLQAAVELARRARDRDLEARALTSISFAAYRLADLAQARQFAEQSLAVMRGAASTKNLARTYNVLGLVAMNEERFAEASQLLEKAIDVARATSDSAVLVRATGNLGLIAMNVGDLQRARAAHRAQRQLARTLGNVEVEANSFTNEANVDIWEGYPRSA